MVIGHRGMGKNHSEIPENTVPSLVDAYKEGADAVEFDVQLTSDSEVVLLHDPLLDRTTGGNGCVAELPLHEVRKLRVRNGARKFPPGVGIPTLAEVLSAIQAFDHPDKPFFANIHIKVFDGFKGYWAGWTNRCPKTVHRRLTDSVYRIVRSMGLQRRVLFTSFDPRIPRTWNWPDGLISDQPELLSRH